MQYFRVRVLYKSVYFTENLFKDDEKIIPFFLKTIKRNKTSQPGKNKALGKEVVHI